MRVTTQVPLTGRMVLVLVVQGNLTIDPYQNKKRYLPITN